MFGSAIGNALGMQQNQMEYEYARRQWEEMQRYQAQAGLNQYYQGMQNAVAPQRPQSNESELLVLLTEV